jgi:hypothetical protein
MKNINEKWNDLQTFVQNLQTFCEDEYQKKIDIIAIIDSTKSWMSEDEQNVLLTFCNFSSTSISSTIIDFKTEINSRVPVPLSGRMRGGGRCSDPDIRSDVRWTLNKENFEDGFFQVVITIIDGSGYKYAWGRELPAYREEKSVLFFSYFRGYQYMYGYRL